MHAAKIQKAQPSYPLKESFGTSQKKRGPDLIPKSTFDGAFQLCANLDNIWSPPVKIRVPFFVQLKSIDDLEE
jgi:hypothetical protein